MEDGRGYLNPTEESGRGLISRCIEDPLVMLNLLRFREFADYTESPELAPIQPISGEKAYGRYLAHAEPLLREAGGKVLFFGRGGPYLIGPPSARWDLMMVVQYQGTQSFLSFTKNKAYLSGVGHRTAALEDSRLLPVSGAWDR